MKNLTILCFIIYSVVYINISFSQDIWEPLNFPDTTQIMSIAANKQGYIFVGVLWDNNSGGVYRSENDGETWEFCGLEKKTILSLTIDNNENIYAGSNIYENSPGIFYSNNNGESWDTIFINNNYLGVIVDIFTVEENTIYVSIWGNTGILLRTYNGGTTWDTIYASGDVAEYITDIEIADNGDLYVCMAAYWMGFGGVYRSSDMGDNWEFLGLLNYTVRAIEFNQNGDLFAGAGTGLFVKYNGVEEWTSLISLNIKEIIINDDDFLFLGCDNYYGVVVSYDNGQDFEFFNTGFEDPWIGSMAIDSSGFLIASKHSSHLLYRTVNSTLITSVPALPNNHPTNNINLFPNPASNLIVAEISDIIANDTFTNVMVLDGTGKIILNLEILFTGQNNMQIDISGLSPGFYIIKFKINEKSYYSKFIKE